MTITEFFLVRFVALLFVEGFSVSLTIFGWWILLQTDWLDQLSPSTMLTMEIDREMREKQNKQKKQEKMPHTKKLYNKKNMRHEYD